MVAAFAVVVLLTLAIAGVHVGGAVVARHRAQAAADLAALAAAAALPAGGDVACARADRVAAAMTSAVAVDCQVDGLDVIITVTLGPARAVARAGPVDTHR